MLDRKVVHEFPVCDICGRCANPKHKLDLYQIGSDDNEPLLVCGNEIIYIANMLNTQLRQLYRTGYHDVMFRIHDKVDIPNVLTIKISRIPSASSNPKGMGITVQVYRNTRLLHSVSKHLRSAASFMTDEIKLCQEVAASCFVKISGLDIFQSSDYIKIEPIHLFRQRLVKL